jgi:Animal haem peroxidase
MKKLALIGLAVSLLFFGAYPSLRNTQLGSCVAYAFGRFREVAQERSERFLGKVHEDTARCRGGEQAAAWRLTPWVDWQRYWATGAGESRSAGLISKLGFLSPNRRGVAGALLDMEYQRIELLRFNLFDNSETFEEYVRGRNGTAGSAIRIWPQLRLPRGHFAYVAVGADGPQQCRGELIRFRNLTGICNDITNPLMGSTGQPFARNVSFDATFPDLGKNDIVINRHGDRLGLLQPDPQVISRKLFSRAQAPNNNCHDAQGLPGYVPEANCDYQKAPVLNVLAAFWIQFMTHDWFSHLEEGHNQSELMAMGCSTQDINNSQKPLSAKEVQQLRCRPEDRVDKSYIAADQPPVTFSHEGKQYLTRAHQTTLNRVTAWWDASQIYGYNDLSGKRVKRDPIDPAKLRLEPVSTGAQEVMGYLPLLQPSDYTS